MKRFPGLLLLAACSSSSPAVESDAALPLVDAGAQDAPVVVDGGYEAPDGGVVRADRFAVNVVAFSPGECAGFGMSNMPAVVLGPPVGGGDRAGSLDVVSLGVGGSIVLGFGENAIVDGAGPDFVVFENPFYAGGDPSRPNAELAEVSVSDDGVKWITFPCTATAFPYGACAGWHPVKSAPGNGISPVDPAVSGGDLFDLADVGMTHARFVRILDRSNPAGCPASPPKPTTLGFDLDAVAVVNAQTP